MPEKAPAPRRTRSPAAPRGARAAAGAGLLLLLAAGCSSTPANRALHASWDGVPPPAGPRAQPAGLAAPDSGAPPQDAVGAYGGDGRRYREPRRAREEPSALGARFAVTVEGSRAIDELDVGDERLWGLGLYVLPDDAPVGFYLNTHFTTHTTGDPDFTDVFAFNAFGHDVVDEELEAWVLNLGVLRALNESVHVFAGLGYSETSVEAELRDPAGIFAGGGTYFQRRVEDEELNVNVGALVTVHPVAVTVQWDTAFEVFSFGVGFTF